VSQQLSTHFSLSEFIASDTASRRGIDNDLPMELYTSAHSTCEMLEKIRSHLCSIAGKTIPILITSGYRCQMLNAAIGSGVTSDHVKARAADFKAPEFGSALAVAQALAPMVSTLGIGQLIYEYKSWIHVSTRLPDKIINRIITIDQRGTRAGIS
jgi:zinc D-Ala-D-Ala carboxypeptidase